MRVVVSSRYAKDHEETVEAIRATPAQVIVRNQNGKEAAYRIADGRSVKRAPSGESQRAVHVDDLATIKAMKPGANAVSKSLDAIKKASKP